MSNVSLGLSLMGIGMVTVFLILLIVIFGSKGIITLINKIVPSETADISLKTRLVIEKAVSEITYGKGKISRITKL